MGCLKKKGGKRVKKSKSKLNGVIKKIKIKTCSPPFWVETPFFLEVRCIVHQCGPPAPLVRAARYYVVFDGWTGI